MYLNSHLVYICIYTAYMYIGLGDGRFCAGGGVAVGVDAGHARREVGIHAACICMIINVVICCM